MIERTLPLIADPKSDADDADESMSLLVLL
jgi:hypothetical protein